MKLTPKVVYIPTGLTYKHLNDKETLSVINEDILKCYVKEYNLYTFTKKELTNLLENTWYDGAKAMKERVLPKRKSEQYINKLFEQ